MSDLWLGVIAVSVLVMAIIQVAAIVFAARAARQVGQLAERIEHDMRPIVTNLQSITADAARTTAMAAATVERADRLLADAALRVEQTLAAVPTLIESVKTSLSVASGLKALLAAFRELRQGRRHPVHAEEEDALFIG